jgi:hypothetical protein
MNGQAGQFAEFGGEGVDFGGLGAEVAGEMEGIADDDGGDLEAAREAGQRAQVFTAIVAALEGQNRLRRQTEFVRDSDADAPVADVEGEIANSFQLLAPSF